MTKVKTNPTEGVSTETSVNDKKELSHLGYFEDGSEPIEHIKWSIGNYVKDGDYYTNSNLVEDCFVGDIPSDGTYDFIINKELEQSGSHPIEGTMIIDNGKIDIPHLSTQIPKDYFKHNRNYFIEYFNFVDGKVESFCGS